MQRNAKSTEFPNEFPDFEEFPSPEIVDEGVNPTNVTNKTFNLISVEFFNQPHTLHNSFTAEHENPDDKDLFKPICTVKTQEYNSDWIGGYSNKKW